MGGLLFRSCGFVAVCEGVTKRVIRWDETTSQAIARALASQPKILLMDEPFGALDVQTKESMQEFMLELWRQTNTTIFMITHDVEEAVFLSQRIYVLSSRPGTVKQELKIELPSERTHHTKIGDRKFQDYKDQVLQLLRQEEHSTTPHDDFQELPLVV